MHRRPTAAPVRQLLVAVAAAASLLGGAHVTAPEASAACEGGWSYQDAIVWAYHGAVVGTIAAATTGPDGWTVATAVNVGRAYRIPPTRAIHGTFYRATCADNEARVGTRVLVLFGIGATAEGAVQPDFFWTIGTTVTQHEIDTLGASLPDTSTAPAIAAADDRPASWLLLVATAVGMGLGLLARRPRRRRSWPGDRPERSG